MRVAAITHCFNCFIIYLIFVVIIVFVIFAYAERYSRGMSRNHDIPGLCRWYRGRGRRVPDG